MQMAQTEEVRQPDLRHRIFAAAGASIVSALLVNPLDVVKTRVQAASIVTDRPLPSCLLSRAPNRFPVRWSQPSALSECHPKLPTGCMSTGIGPAAAASAAGAAPHLLPRRPLPGQLPAAMSSACACALRVADLGPDHLGTHHPDRCANARAYRPVTASGVMRDIVRKEGVAALWRGTDTAMLASIPMVGVYMPLYDYLLARLTAAAAAAAGEGAPPGGSVSGYAPLVAGSAARTLAVLLVAPLELVRTRQQGNAGGARTAWEAVRETLQDTGAAAGGGASGSGRGAAGAAPQAGAGLGSLLRAAPRLWTGVGATLARDVPFSAIYWGLVERIRGELLPRWQQVPPAGQQQEQQQEQQQGGPVLLRQRGEEHGLVGDSPQSHSSSSSGGGGAVMAANLIAGSAAGAVAALVTTPFDVVKTQLQIGDVRGGGAGGSGGGGGGGGGSGLGMARRILREEGGAGLFRGWAPRAARTAPACAVVVASYEVLKLIL
ncbi:hypothetical protein PLESTB_000960100 [Pleodorina starrii]|uniref:Mitochondrial carrier protein n=1 Tax=Pleodorina starrii TaxID=330485 RepID=A0A9W6BNT4_9CHLO|nr:hypothetical protein PLESTM_001138000 [Pleodorina starrii]GLC55210.1 hypothetical protein PLESTB_000960100 [Pleodorina starrii]GLC71034.1 hypothetical protein PLESTF_001063000 [Pleodorina starrii]